MARRQPLEGLSMALGGPLADLASPLRPFDTPRRIHQWPLRPRLALGGAIGRTSAAPASSLWD
eukprot:14680449-Alexandrium_andersonii.AAC.1